MDENEITLLNHSKMNVIKVGKLMGTFSIFAALTVLLIVAAGLFLLFYSNTLPDDMPHYLDNILGLLGIGLVLVAASLLPALVLLRRARQMAAQLKISSDITTIRSFLRANHDLWRYTTTLLIVLFILAVLFFLMLYIYLFPTLSTL